MIAVIERDDDAAVGKIQTVDADQRRKNGIAAFGDVLRADFVRVAAVFRKVDQDWMQRFAVVTELRAAALAQAFADFRITRSAQRIDEIAENLLARGDALLRHHGVGIVLGEDRSPFLPRRRDVFLRACRGGLCRKARTHHKQNADRWT